MSRLIVDFHARTTNAETLAPIHRKTLDDYLAVFATASPYLRDLSLREPTLLTHLARDGAETCLTAFWPTVIPRSLASQPLASVMRDLRCAKGRLALITAIGDLFDDWPLLKITGALSRFAEATVDTTVSHLLAEAAKRGEIGEEDAARGGGLFILGMGKLGAFELNYSSDIDLIAFYDPTLVTYRGRHSRQEMFVRLIQQMVKILQERTADGYVFRVDLQLRPDPGAMPVALPLPAAEVYYQSIGQNWERAAFIKARPIAGDVATGNTFLRDLRPFVWRKHLDFPAVRDLQRMKRRIRDHHGHGAVTVEGQDVKLGPGGIREIEFFAQIQQLVLGGREPDLRSPATLDTLDRLVAHGWLTARDRDALSRAYHFLRMVEHRLQMIADQQTHLVPKQPEDVLRLARFCGFENSARFRATLLGHLHDVHRQFTALYAEADDENEDEAQPPLPQDRTALTGVLGKAGFADPDKIARLIEGWRIGRHRCFRHESARNLLEHLAPALVETFAVVGEPDAAFLRLDEFFSRQASGVHLLALLDAQRALLDLVAEIMGTAPLLAQTLARRPALLDSVASGEALRPLSDATLAADDLDTALWDVRDYQDLLDAVRRWAADRRFAIGLQHLKGMIDVHDAGLAFSAVGDAAVTTLLARILAEFENQHGRMDGSGFAVLGFGKFGGRELTISSDLDLVFLFTVPGGTQGSDGPKPLTPGLYYTRLGQRLIAALSALTAEGSLYDVDMELRPAGKSGALATSLGAFIAYYQHHAWTWEHMALTRARVVAASTPAFAGTVHHTLEDLKRLKRPVAKLKADAAAMRGRMEQDRPGRGPEDLKFGTGGLIDIEFIAQTTLLATTAQSDGTTDTSTLPTDTRGMIAHGCAQGVLSPRQAESLKRAEQLFATLTALLRLTAGDSAPWHDLPLALRLRCAEIAGVTDHGTLEEQITARQAEVRTCLISWLSNPKAAYIPGDDRTTGALLRPSSSLSSEDQSS